ncbi:hypothetical protein [Desulfotomaculum nigrificans]|uniref:hypothetical protein n=1 Tax=Desulfotomaculum nigrificans TaxID=1565 RepID=UPI0001FAEB27|nr:hypothetical protein [Desulfotomaculum nigrificans]
MYQEDQRDVLEEMMAWAFRFSVGIILGLIITTLIPIIRTLWQVTASHLYCRRVKNYDANRLPLWLKGGDGN